MIGIVTVLLLPLVTALLCLVTRRKATFNQGFALAGAAALLVATIALFVEVLDKGFVSFQSGGWIAPFGITLIADLMSASMLLITAIIGLAVTIYSIVDIDRETQERQYFALVNFLLLGVNGAFLTGDLFNLYVWFEVMLLASFVLITLGDKRQHLEGGVKYLVINIVSSFLFLCGLGLLYGKLGTLNMADIAVRVTASENALLINSSAILLLAAFSIKAALFPFFFWLPASYHTARPAISALFAGLLTKVGTYALIRSYTLIFGSQFDTVQDILLLLAGGTMITGVLGAAAQYEIRKILSFHIVSQIGYITMGLAIGTKIALAAAVFYTLHHIIVKANLFLISGLIERRSGSTQLKTIGGLYQNAPLLALVFFIPAFSLGGIPPLSGFWAKFGVIQAGIDAGHWWLVATALLVGVMTLFSMTKIWAEAFWKKAPDDSVRVDPQAGNLKLWGPVVALAALTLWIGLFSGPLFNLSLRAAEQLTNPELYIEEVLGPDRTNLPSYADHP